MSPGMNCQGAVPTSLDRFVRQKNKSIHVVRRQDTDHYLRGCPPLVTSIRRLNGNYYFMSCPTAMTGITVFTKIHQ